MEFSKNEILAVQNVDEQSKPAAVELGELQMALVGGGCGEVIFH